MPQNNHIFQKTSFLYNQQNNFQQNQDFGAPQNTNQPNQTGEQFKQNRYKSKKCYKPKATRQFQQNPNFNGNDEQQFMHNDGHSQFVQGESSGTFVPTCYICRQTGHYANQCPAKGKGPVVNMVIPEI